MTQVDEKEAALLVSALELKCKDIAHRMGLKGAVQYRHGMALELDACETLKAKLSVQPALKAVAK